MGWRMHEPDSAIPAGIKHVHSMHPKVPPHMRWSSRAIKGPVYMETDKGSQRKWLREIGKTEEPWCVCDGWTTQNAVHLQRYPWVGDGKGRSAEQMWRDDARWWSSLCNVK